VLVKVPVFGMDYGSDQSRRNGIQGGPVKPSSMWIDTQPMEDFPLAIQQ
jgi:hypothetical protein